MSNIRQLSILPTPQLVLLKDGVFVFNKETSINPLNAGAQLLSEIIFQEMEINLLFSKFDADSKIRFLNFDKVSALLRKHNLGKNELFHNQGYILDISKDSINIYSNTLIGYFYAIQSLHFLVKSATAQNAIPCCQIIDWPHFKMRGITDDISRGQVSTMENFKKIIRFLAHYKMNIYMPYLEDLFQFECYPSIGKNRGALSAQECIELQNYAADYNVEIIPIFQTLGHWENLLFQDEFVHLADFPGSASLDVTSEQTYQFLDKMFAEIIPVFRSVYFHMGADESFDVGRGASRDATKRHGIASVHAAHYRRVIDIIKNYDKKIMMYGDIVLEHPMILNEIPKDLILFDWHYEAAEHYPSTEIFRKSNQPFIVSPGIQNWSRIFPKLTIALGNIRQFTLDGYNNGAIGAITSNWGDFGGANFRELNYYLYAYAAETAWNTDGADLTQFEDTFFRDFYGTDDPAFANVYHLLGKLSDYYDIDHLFAHPFYPIDDKKEKNVQRAYDHEHFGIQLKKEIEKLRETTNNNVDHLDYLELCAEMYAWIGKLTRAKVEMYQLLHFYPDSPKQLEQVNRLANRLEDCKTDLERIQSSYKNLWERSNRPDNLEIILKMIGRVFKIIEIKIGEVKAGNFDFNGRMPASFISHPKAEKQNELPLVCFRKKIKLREILPKTWLQIIAQSHAYIWVNGQEVGHITARRSLSGVAEQWRVKAWDISKYLNAGENTIAIRVRNYVPGEHAAANIWIESPDANITITSDEHWKVLDRIEDGWIGSDFNDDYWAPAVPIKNRWIISRPYFEHEILSRIEFFSETVDF